MFPLLSFAIQWVFLPKHWIHCVKDSLVINWLPKIVLLFCLRLLFVFFRDWICLFNLCVLVYTFLLSAFYQYRRFSWTSLISDFLITLGILERCFYWVAFELCSWVNILTQTRKILILHFNRKLLSMDTALMRRILNGGMKICLHLLYSGRLLWTLVGDLECLVLIVWHKQVKRIL